ncbi:MAG: GGDEF domain-containing protein [Candidatus Dormibacteria bacterium]
MSDRATPQAPGQVPVVALAATGIPADALAATREWYQEHRERFTGPMDQPGIVEMRTCPLYRERQVAPNRLNLVGLTCENARFLPHDPLSMEPPYRYGCALIQESMVDLAGDAARQARRHVVETRLWPQVGGPLMTLATLLVLQLVSQRLYPVSNPTLLYLAVVILASYTSGVRSGLISAALTVIYAIFSLSRPGHLFTYDLPSLTGLLVLALAAPAVAFMVGLLQQRIGRRAADLVGVTQVVRTLAGDLGGADTRQLLCQAALGACGADWSGILEPAPGQRLSLTGATGAVAALGQDVTAPAASEAFTSLRPVFVSDLATASGLGELRQAMGEARSCLFHPVLAQGAPAGVLVLAWNRTQRRIAPRVVAVARLFAAEAAVNMERADLLARLEGMARTDALTGVSNRRVLDEQLPREMARALRTAQSLTVVLIDLDHFKDYNDRLGHQAGDVLLQDATNAWQAHLRPSDLLARYGGEEFMLVLPGCDADLALVVLARMAGSMPEDQSFSAGVACWDGVESAAALVARADQGVYSAKAQGRHRSVVVPAGGLAAI